MTEITAVLNVHREGILAHASLLSMIDAKRTVEAAGISVEILIVADCPDRPMRDYLSGAEDLGARVLETDVHDLGLARNFAVAAGSGRFMAFLDGDDLWGRQWLLAAYTSATQDTRRIVWHPEANLFFGSNEPTWLMHPDIETSEGDWVNLALRNHWTSLCFAAREVFQQVPYPKTDLNGGFGYEDWSWNAETVARGCLHKPVPGTAHLVRVRKRSLVRLTAAANALVIPSSLFRDRIGWATKVAPVPEPEDGGGRLLDPLGL